jgi:hypothetical protein
MISSKQFGVHTHMFNSTEDPSQIRFGGFNKDLFNEGHDIIMMETRAKSSWEVKFDSAGFYSEEVWKGWHALIDPGYPFIALPKQAFEMFKNDLMKAYPDEPVTCSDDEWCYFISPCSKIVDNMPDLQFTFPVKHADAASVTYRIPAKSFLFDDRDVRTKLSTCHLGIVKQRFSELDHFVLGSAFMENFYTVFDASDADVNRIGLSSNIEQVVAEKPAPSSSSSAGGSALSMWVGIIAVVVFAIFVAVITSCICVRKRKQQKLEKAKTYFDSLKTEQDGDQVDDASTALNTSDGSNPNNFLKSTNETANERLVGDLL